MIILGILIIPIKAQIKENETYIDSVSEAITGIMENLVKIQDNYYAIISYGLAGNIGIFIGDEGVVLIDDQYATLSKRIREMLSTITQKPTVAIINTHYHYDHTLGNVAFGAEKIHIIAHENARLRMSERQVIPTWYNVVQKPYPEEALPVLTFTEKATLYIRPEIIELSHYENAHSDGDIAVHFKNADVYHTGDLFINFKIPFITHIDEAAGADIYGMIGAIDQLLLQSGETTKFIPGHGPVGSKKELQAFRDLLSTIRDNVEELFKKNKDLNEIIKDTKIKINNDSSEADRFIEQVYRSVKKHVKQ